MPYCKIPMVTSVAIRLLYQEHKLRICEIAKKIPEFHETYYQSTCQITIPTSGSLPIDKRKYNRGRPRKLTERDERKILRSVVTLRKDIGPCFPSTKIEKESGVSHACNRLVRLYLNKHGLYFRHSRKKGLVTVKDRLNRVKFARKVLTRLTSEFWTKGVSFYLDGVGFVHKTNPSEHGRYNGNMAYRRKSDGLVLSAKGKKEGVNGKVPNLLLQFLIKRVLCYVNSI